MKLHWSFSLLLLRIFQSNIIYIKTQSMQIASYVSIGLASRPYLIYFSYKNLKNSLVTLLLYFTFQNSLFQWIVRNKSHTFSLQNLLRGNKIPINSPTIGACTGRISVVPFLSFGQSCLWTKLVHSIFKEGNVVGSISSFPSSTTITDTFKTLDGVLLLDICPVV